MNEELKYSLQKYSDAIDKLKEGVEKAQCELEKDGVIQRFEFSFELLWKTIKVFLKEKGIDASTPKENLKEAFRLQWISDESIILNMLEDRNKTSHIYDQATSEEIFSRIKEEYLDIFIDFLNKLKTLDS